MLFRSKSVVRSEVAIGVLRLTDDAATRTHWNHGFETELTVAVTGQTLEVELVVTNTGETSFEFTAALHTYFRVDDIRQLELQGLQRQMQTEVQGRVRTVLDAAGVFVRIGNSPNTELFHGQLPPTADGFIPVDHRQCTSLDMV